MLSLRLVSVPFWVYLHSVGASVTTGRRRVIRALTETTQSTALQRNSYTRLSTGISKLIVFLELEFHLVYSGLTFRGMAKMFAGLSYRRLEEMKTVVHGLVLPHELPENRRLAKERRKCMKRLRKQVNIGDLEKSLHNVICTSVVMFPEDIPRSLAAHVPVDRGFWKDSPMHFILPRLFHTRRLAFRCAAGICPHVADYGAAAQAC